VSREGVVGSHVVRGEPRKGVSKYKTSHKCVCCAGCLQSGLILVGTQ
jgi:hypothetical protein